MSRHSYLPLTHYLLLKISCEEVKGIMMSLKSDSVAGWDNIFATTLKTYCLSLVCVIGHVVPVLKNEKRDCTSNYRFRFLCYQLRPDFEKIIIKRLVNFLE